MSLERKSLKLTKGLRGAQLVLRQGKQKWGKGVRGKKAQATAGSRPPQVQGRPVPPGEQNIPPPLPPRRLPDTEAGARQGLLLSHSPPLFPPSLPASFPSIHFYRPSVCQVLCRWWEYEDDKRVPNLKLSSSKTSNQQVQQSKQRNYNSGLMLVNVPDPGGLRGSCGHFHLAAFQ